MYSTEPLVDDRTMLYAPLAIGGHVDHVVTRIAAECLGRGVLRYYADVPYVFAVERPNPPRLVEERTEVDVESWVRAALVHRSQIRGFFGDTGSVATALRAWSRGCALDDPWDHGPIVWAPDRTPAGPEQVVTVTATRSA